MKNHGDLLYLCTTVKLDILIAEETYLSVFKFIYGWIVFLLEKHLAL